jgi:GDSL-like Lipase/Acylhydrolase family
MLVDSSSHRSLGAPAKPVVAAAAMAPVLLAAALLGALPTPVRAGPPRLRIVALGDSYGSGEGNPDTAAQGCVPDPAGLNAICATPAVWGNSDQSNTCHRSAKAWPSLSADRLRQQLGAEVEFISFACSGAKVNDLIDQRQKPRFQTEPQIDELEDAFSLKDGGNKIHGSAPPPQIDALLVSIGGNDIGFAPTLIECLIAPACFAFPTLYPGSHNDADLASLESLLRDRYRRLQQKLAEVNARGFIKIANVFLTEYPNPMYDERGALCGFPHRPVGDYLDGGSQLEMKWAAEKVLPMLDRMVKEGAEMLVPPGPKGFYVSGIADATHLHGFCSNERFINLVRDSMQQQGDHDGAVHPNSGGQGVYADAVVPMLGRIVPPAPREFSGPDGSPGETTTFLPQGTRLAWGSPDAHASNIQVAQRAVWLGATQALESPLQPPEGRGVTPWGSVLSLGAAERSWTIAQELQGSQTHAIVPTPTQATDYVVRFCTDAMCSAWSQPVRVAAVSGLTLAPASLIPTWSAGAGLAVNLASIPDVNTEYRVAYRRVAAALPYVRRDGISDAQPAAGLPGNLPSIGPASPPRAPVWNRWAGHSSRVALNAPDPGVYAVFARQCGWSFDSALFRSTETCGRWTPGVEVANTPPPAVPTLSVRNGQAEWLASQESFVASYQMASRALAHWTTHEYATTVHSAPLTDLYAGNLAKLGAITVRACNAAGCTAWAPLLSTTSGLLPGAPPADLPPPNQPWVAAHVDAPPDAE